MISVLCVSFHQHQSALGAPKRNSVPLSVWNHLVRGNCLPANPLGLVSRFTWERSWAYLVVSSALCSQSPAMLDPSQPSYVIRLENTCAVLTGQIINFYPIHSGRIYVHIGASIHAHLAPATGVENLSSFQRFRRESRFQATIENLSIITRFGLV